MFPAKRGETSVTCHEPISATIAAISSYVAWAGSAIAAAAGASTLGAVAFGEAFAFVVMGIGTLAISTGVSMATSLLTGGKPPSADNQTRNAHLLNFRQPGGPRPIRYGLTRFGGTWVYWNESGAVNGKLNAVIEWGEGEMEGAAKDVDTPNFSGKGLNDFQLSGTFTGVDGRYEVKVETVTGGGANTFKLSTDGGSTWGAETPMDATTPVSLGNGLYGLWGSTAGHNKGDKWTFTAGDGLWLGDSLAEFYHHFKGDGPVRDLVPYHNFHQGTATQTVDADLQAVCPLWRNPLRYRCYSYIQLAFSENGWQSIPEAHLFARCRKLYDPRSGFTSWYQTTAVKAEAAAADDHVHVDDTSHMTDGMWIRFTLDDGTTHATTVSGAPPAGDIVNITDAIPAGRHCDVDAMVEFNGAHPQGRNGALVFYDVATNAKYGCGRPTAKVNTQSIIDAANWIDAQGWYWDGSIDARQSGEDTLRDIEVCFRGYHYEVGGVLYLKIWADDTAAMTLDDTKNEINIHPDAMTVQIPGIVDSFNKVIAHYNEPALKYASNQAYWEDAARIALDGEVRATEINLIGVADLITARQLAKFEYYRKYVYNKTFNAEAAPRAAFLDPGDNVTFKVTWAGWTAGKKFRVALPTQSQDQRTVLLNVMEEHADIYDTTVDTTPQVPIVPVPGPSTPDMDGYTPVVTASRRGIKIDWSDWDDSGYELVKFVVYVSTDAACPRVDANKWGEYGPKTKKCNVTGLTPGLTYYVVIVPYDRRGAGIPSEIA